MTASIRSTHCDGRLSDHAAHRPRTPRSVSPRTADSMLLAINLFEPHAGRLTAGHRVDRHYVADRGSVRLSESDRPADCAAKVLRASRRGSIPSTITRSLSLPDTIRSTRPGLTLGTTPAITITCVTGFNILGHNLSPWSVIRGQFSVVSRSMPILRASVISLGPTTDYEPLTTDSSYHFACQRHDLHEILFTQLAGNRAENSGAASDCFPHRSPQRRYCRNAHSFHRGEGSAGLSANHYAPHDVAIFHLTQSGSAFFTTQMITSPTRATLPFELAACCC